MKQQLPNPDLSTASLFNLPDEVVKWQTLKTALQLKIFDYLQIPKTADELSTQLQTDNANTALLLNALTALGCLHKERNKFYNTTSSNDCWLSTGETSLLKSFLFSSQWVEPILNDQLTSLIKHGAPKAQRNIGNDKLWQEAAYASLNHTRCTRAGVMSELISRLPEFSGFKRILDLGAGPGIIGIAVTMKHPTLNCTLFDQQGVCKVADEVIQEYELTARVQTLSGDYMQDSFGEGYDFIMANFTLNFFRDNLQPLFTRIYSALNAGGVFLVSADGMEQEKTSPAATVFSWLPTAVQGSDLSFIKGEIAEAMLAAGFRSTCRFPLTDIPLEAHGPIEISIGRK